jgi:hypothetical protein
VTDFDEMGKKTVFRRASKWLPLSPELRDAMEKDGDGLEDDPRQVTGRVVETTEKPLQRIPNPYAEPEPEASAEPPPQSPAEVSSETEQAALVSEIKAALKSTTDTVATFAPKCREAGLLANGVQLAAAPVEDLRTILYNLSDISSGNYIPICG